MKKLWILFKATFLISASTSGGYVILSMMRRRFVEDLKWISDEEMLNLTSLAQSAPGPIAINGSILLGYRICGYAGAYITMLGTVLPPLIIMSLVTYFYDFVVRFQLIRFMLRGMQAGVAAIIFDVTVGLFINVVKQKSIVTDLLMVLAFAVAFFTKISIFYLAIFCAACGLVKTYLLLGKEGRV
ncbi:MAG: chromate transporter [Eubacteriaceae bacterium]|nr:chromate transporter [Eubacteriaceae bacterium]